MKTLNQMMPFTIIMLYRLISVSMVTSSFCPRLESKLVRRLLNKEIIPFYQQFNAVIPHSCPFSPSRDIYGYQEENKFEESATKWVCDFCGKSFYEERFLDQHFDNRHPETKREVCVT
ncbi:hypothetical protein LSH36_101g01058 [Paralvinella palmiformis]|uniref:C2H2-type domain-containing protein n=1 Tax=Paralvinella palmiformis TaxID=53620 RepID=A0AAD9N9V8_9ANNE|nr:hypothetical protein LSH36_101g01058 [Paralvinella palmiformis]